MERLKIWMLPTLALVKHEKTTDYVVGFDELGGKDDFQTEVKFYRYGVAVICISTLYLSLLLDLCSGIYSHEGDPHLEEISLCIELASALNIWPRRKCNLQVLEERLLQAGLLISLAADVQQRPPQKQPNITQSSIARRHADSDEDSDFE